MLPIFWDWCILEALLFFFVVAVLLPFQCHPIILTSYIPYSQQVPPEQTKNKKVLGTWKTNFWFQFPVAVWVEVLPSTPSPPATPQLILGNWSHQLSGLLETATGLRHFSSSRLSETVTSVMNPLNHGMGGITSVTLQLLEGWKSWKFRAHRHHGCISSNKNGNYQEDNFEPILFQMLAPPPPP